MKFKIYCINLYERTDRYLLMKKQFEKNNLDVTFIRNYKHKLGGRYGCFNSHIQCLKDAKKNNIDVCLIFEDDILLKSNINKLIKECLEFINNNNKVDILYGIGQTTFLDKFYTNNIYSGKSFSTGCIFLTKKSIFKVLKKYKKFINYELHYDHFLYIHLKKSFICINTICNFISNSSDNDIWDNNIIIKFNQKLLNYTTLHLKIYDKIIKNLFIFLIKNNINQIKKILINNINKSSYLYYLKKISNSK